jgi:pSer/pThr/pTyr-binding forkhead associated (FHA) protein
MMGGVDFPTWFTIGYYGGMACCMLAIAGNALYTMLLKKGSTHQLTATIITCVLSALLLLPALFWFNLHFMHVTTTVSTIEVTFALIYVTLWGWLLPIGASVTYCLLSTPRTTITSNTIAAQKRTTRENPTSTDVQPPRHQPGVVAPFVYDQYSPWGWLEYRSGSFHGQRMELKHSIITIGRDEKCDIWIDDDMASRLHAELAWHQGQVYLTDCDSLNGVILNGSRVRGFHLIVPDDILEIGSYRFTLLLADQKQAIDEQNDPLANHTWRTIEEVMGADIGKKFNLPITVPPAISQNTHKPVIPRTDTPWQETDKIAQPQVARPRLNGLVVIKGGELAGQTFLLDRPVLTAGRGIECDIIINDTSISKQHVQLSRQVEGDYVQDLTSRNGTSVNGVILQSPRLLQNGDCIQIGNIQLEYAVLQTTQPTTQPTPPPISITPPPLHNTRSGPIPLRLPSRPTQNR